MSPGLKTSGQVSRPIAAQLDNNLTLSEVWIEGNNWNRTAVSGVGRWGDYDDIISVTVPTDPQNRHDNHSGPGATMDVNLTPTKPILFTRPDEIDTPWGYGFHESCWSIFTKNYTPNLEALFAACLSMPTGANALLDWGHDYGGAASIIYENDIPVHSSRFQDLITLPQELQSDPYRIPGLVNAIKGAARLQNDVFLSHWEPKEQDFNSDSFSCLVPELLQAIVVLLPTSDVHSLRLASPVFATLELPERFWASRFQADHEFGYLPEVHDHPPESWRAFYLSLKTWTCGIPSIANRRRVWGIAKRLQATLTQLDGVSCQGSPLDTWIESVSENSDPDKKFEAGVSWHTAARAVAEPDQFFSYGCRVLRARAIYFPEPVKLRRMTVSFVKTVAGRFISGFRLTDHHGCCHTIGYQHEDAMVLIPLTSGEPIQGWELALDISGVKGIAVVYNNGTLSSWAGESAGLPRWRLTGTQAVSAVKAEFDALKLVSLSRDKSPNQENWLNNCLWYPEVPKEGFVFNGSRGNDPPPEFNLPMTTVFFGESDGRHVSSLSEVVIWIFDICHVAGIEFRFTDSSHNRYLGHIGPFDENYPVLRNFDNSHDSTVSFPIDGPSGERLSSLEIKTNLDRSIQTPDFPYGADDDDWVTVHSKGSETIGMFATC
ncbi:hypothetical protein IL306_007590, partial [Fusarium sp. DS 682]